MGGYIKVDFREKNIIRDRESHFIMTKGMHLISDFKTNQAKTDITTKRNT